MSEKKKIFINYRREDEANIAYAISNSLMREFGVSNVFFDRQAIQPGSVFPQEIDKALKDCGIFIPIIGKEWLKTLKQRQAFEERDYVLNEIEHALGKRILVLPILVDDTSMPSKKDLPPKLGELSLINAIKISSDPERLPGDIKLLIVALNDIISRSPKSPGSHFMGGSQKPNLKKLRWIIGLTASMIVIAVLAVLYFKGNFVEQKPTEPEKRKSEISSTVINSINDNDEQKPVEHKKEKSEMPPTIKKNIVPMENEVSDIDGNIYKTVIIGTQVWMKENLKTTKYNDGSDIQLVTDFTIWGRLSTPAYCWYNNDISNKVTYGALYNGYAVSTNKLCPTGWHVPTDDEWYILENYLDPSVNDPDAILWRGVDCGIKLKESGLSGFNAKMGGGRTSPPDMGDFIWNTRFGYFFTSTDYDLNHLWVRILNTLYPDNHVTYPGNKINRCYQSKVGGNSIRCLKN